MLKQYEIITIINTLENYNGEENVLEGAVEKNKILIETMEASLLCQNRILAKLFWADCEGQSGNQIK